VLVTRAAQQAASLADPLRELGADVLLQPAIEIDLPQDMGRLDSVLSRLDEFETIVFSSANGVEFFCRRLLSIGRDLRSLGKACLAAIGPGTAEALAGFHLRADVVPMEFRAEALAEALGKTAAGQRVLLVRASRGREVLAEQLIAAGANVEQVVAYESRDVTNVDSDIAADLTAGQVDWITVTSSAIARALASQFGDALRNARLVSISPITSAALRDLGFEPAAEAREYTMEGVIAALRAAHDF
jgi:uroporphyrinogen III methyltransferase/synthase